MARLLGVDDLGALGVVLVADEQLRHLVRVRGRARVRVRVSTR